MIYTLYLCIMMRIRLADEEHIDSREFELNNEEKLRKIQVISFNQRNIPSHEKSIIYLFRRRPASQPPGPQWHQSVCYKMVLRRVNL